MSKQKRHLDLPDGFYAAANRKFGYFTQAPTTLDAAWSGNVFIAPPKSDTKEWLDRCVEEMQRGNCRQIVAVVPNRLNSRYFMEDVFGRAEIHIVVGLPLVVVVYRKVKKIDGAIIAGVVEGGEGSWAFL